AVVVRGSLRIDRRRRRRGRAGRRDRTDRRGRRGRRRRADRRGRRAEGLLELLERRQIAQVVETEVHQELARGRVEEGLAHDLLAPRDAHNRFSSSVLSTPTGLTLRSSWISGP